MATWYSQNKLLTIIILILVILVIVGLIITLVFLLKSNKDALQIDPKIAKQGGDTAFNFALEKAKNLIGGNTTTNNKTNNSKTNPTPTPTPNTTTNNTNNPKTNPTPNTNQKSINNSTPSKPKHNSRHLLAKRHFY